MNWVVYLFGGGLIFFIGVAIIWIAVILALLTRPVWLVRMSTIVAIVGLILIVLSAAPLPYWLYSLAGAITILWLAVERGFPRALLNRRVWLRIATVAVWTLASVAELP